jgi:signal transduction histidine kinase
VPTLTVLGAIRRRRFLLTLWPWRSLVFLLTTLPLAAVTAVPIGLFAAPWILLLRFASTGRVGLFSGLLLFLAGAALLGCLGPFAARPVAAVERHRLRLVDDRPPPAGRHRWRAFGYAVLLVTAVPVVYAAAVVTIMLTVAGALSPWLVADGPVSFGLVTITTVGQAVPYSIGGSLLLIAVPYLLGALAGGHAALARAVLSTGPHDELRAELVEVSASRARLAGAFEAERHRIERDLHDGAQQKLVGLTLQLGLAQLDLPEHSPAAGAVATAHAQAKELMGELRELIHGIRPQILTELGLPAALRELAGHSVVPVTVDADLAGRPAEPLEATVYFVVAEALANVAKHSGARAARVSVRHAGGELVAEVVDDGRGGADPAAVAGGRMRYTSPPGGPTVIRVELPWSW